MPYVPDDTALMQALHQEDEKAESGGILKFEARIGRSKIKGLQGTGFKIGITATKNDWSAIIGALPGTGVPAFYMDMTE